MSKDPRKTTSADIELTASAWILRRDAGFTSNEEAEFQRWQASDPSHAEAVARKDRAWSFLNRPLNSGQADLLLERLEVAARKRRRQRFTTMTAGVAILLFGAVLFQRTNTAVRTSHEQRAVVVMPETRTLPDGSVIELRFGAEVAVHIGARTRRVLLNKGEAYFRVAKDEDRPFVVRAGEVEFRAIGTEFSVELQSSQIELVVTEGSVGVGTGARGLKVDSRAPEQNETRQTARRASVSSSTSGVGRPLGPAVVDAGNRLLIGAESGAANAALSPVPMGPREIAERLSWRAPKVEFSEITLREAVQIMNRYNTVRMTIEDPALSQLRVSGLFRTDNIDTFVRLLEATCGIRAERADDTIRLSRAGR